MEPNKIVEQLAIKIANLEIEKAHLVVQIQELESKESEQTEIKEVKKDAE
ncbi:hypothetical protein [Enterococcus sp. AZ109]